MTILERFKLEINKRDYFTDEEYSQFLSEENLTSADTFNKSEHYKSLLKTVVNVLNMVSNDTDLMRKITDNSTEYSMSQAYTNLANRIHQIQLQIAQIADKEGEESNSIIHPFII